MAVIDFPNELMLTQVKVTPKFFNYKETSQSGKVISKSRDLQQFDVEFSFVCLNKRELLILNSFIAQLNGDTNTFKLPLSEITENLGRFRSGTLNADANAGSEEVQVKNSRGRLVDGQLVNIGNDTKVYIVREFDGNRFKVIPTLRTDRKENDAVIVGDDVTFHLRMNESSFDISDENGNINIIKFTASEVL